jgi:hypothetical protein
MRHESKTFVASDERGVIGLAAVTVVDYGVEAYAMIEAGRRSGLAGRLGRLRR